MAQTFIVNAVKRTYSAGIWMPIVAALIGISIGVLIGYYSTRGSRIELDNMRKLTRDEYKEKPEITQKILDNMDPEKIRQNLKEITTEPHVSGSAQDINLSNMIRDTMVETGLDRVYKVPYKVLLSYPDLNNSNKVEVLNPNGAIEYNCSTKESLRGGDYHPDLLGAFHGYSPNGSTRGRVVYVNYGTAEDFELLVKMGIDLKGKIALARYGKIFRGNKVQNAENQGMVGALVYSDPAETAADGLENEYVYPNTWWLPDDGIQRGSVIVTKGDPQTPGFPSKDWVYRKPVNEVKLPGIPSQPISARDGQYILSLLAGEVAPPSWQGKLNLTYRIGPSQVDKTVRITVTNKLEQKEIFNVIGVINGSVEPDRYVLFGNHYDAWGFGATDPGTGTAVLLEVARVLGHLVSEKVWRPRRTILLCAWGAEEQALIGSTEWVEENLPHFMNRAVAYINADTVVAGKFLEMTSSPLLNQAVYHITGMIPNPGSDKETVLSQWAVEYNKKYNTSIEFPPTWPTGSGTDTAPFNLFAGVPSIDIYWTHDKQKYPNTSMYPAYHTGYDTFDMVDKHIDPGFRYHQAAARIAGGLLRYIADSALLPYDIRYLTQSLEGIRDKMFSDGTADLLKQRGIGLGNLSKAVTEFGQAAIKWHQTVEDLDYSNPVQVRMRNDQIMQIERIFLKPEGLPEQPYFRHVLFAPSRFDSYSSSGFPVIQDLLVESRTNPEDQSIWRKMEEHISEITVFINRATTFIKPCLLI